jgi:hypothetical protein
MIPPVDKNEIEKATNDFIVAIKKIEAIYGEMATKKDMSLWYQLKMWWAEKKFYRRLNKAFK